MGNAVVIIVAQRISTIMDADQIIVLDKGSMPGIWSSRRTGWKERWQQRMNG